MSELVEQAARAMCLQADFNPDEVMSNDGPLWRYYVPQARAAIAAVAEWLDGRVHMDDENQQALIADLRAAAGSAPTTPEVK